MKRMGSATYHDWHQSILPPNGIIYDLVTLWCPYYNANRFRRSVDRRSTSGARARSCDPNDSSTINLVAVIEWKTPSWFRNTRAKRCHGRERLFSLGPFQPAWVETVLDETRAQHRLSSWILKFLLPFWI